MMIRDLWWRIRGVGLGNFRTRCARCWRTGQAHWSLWGCRRFTAKEIKP